MAPKRKKKYDRVVGIDLGNGLVKIRSVHKDGKPYRLTLPSAFAFLKDVGDKFGSSSLKLDKYLIDGNVYVWGEDIQKVDNLKTTYGHEGRYKTLSYKVMAQIVLGRVARDLGFDAKEKVFVITGVPSIETNTEREGEIAKAFIGENGGFHDISVGDEDLVVRVADVHVTAQALATVIGRYIDEDGSVLDEEYETMKVAVVDIGAGTTDLDIVHGLRRQKGYHSVPKGFKDVYDSIREEILRKYPSHTVTDYDLLTALEEAKKKAKSKDKVVYEYKPSKLSEPVDYTDALDSGVEEVAMSVQQAIMDKWKEQTDLDEILLVGGSADMFKEYLDNVVYGITIPDNNGDSNVEGYFRLGMSINENGDE